MTRPGNKWAIIGDSSVVRDRLSTKDETLEVAPTVLPYRAGSMTAEALQPGLQPRDLQRHHQLKTVLRTVTLGLPVVGCTVMPARTGHQLVLLQSPMRPLPPHSPLHSDWGPQCLPGFLVNNWPASTCHSWLASGGTWTVALSHVPPRIPFRNAPALFLHDGIALLRSLSVLPSSLAICTRLGSTEKTKEMLLCMSRIEPDGRELAEGSPP